jgi:hypothetical protein
VVPAVVVSLGAIVGAVASGGSVTVGVVGVIWTGEPAVTSCGNDSDGVAAGGAAWTSCALAAVATGMAESARTAAIAVTARGERGKGWFVIEQQCANCPIGARYGTNTGQVDRRGTTNRYFAMSQTIFHEAADLRQMNGFRLAGRSPLPHKPPGQQVLRTTERGFDSHASHSYMACSLDRFEQDESMRGDPSGKEAVRDLSDV